MRGGRIKYAGKRKADSDGSGKRHWEIKMWKRICMAISKVVVGILYEKRWW